MATHVAFMRPNPSTADHGRPQKVISKFGNVPQDRHGVPDMTVYCCIASARVPTISVTLGAHAVEGRIVQWHLVPASRFSVILP